MSCADTIFIEISSSPPKEPGGLASIACLISAASTASVSAGLISLIVSNMLLFFTLIPNL